MVKRKLIHEVGLERTIQELYTDFQLDNRVKNLSDMTIRFYDQNFIHFMRFTHELGIENVSEIKKKLIDKFIMHLKDKDLADTTINTYMRATRAFLYFAMREDYLSKFEINLIKADKKQKEPYTEDEIKKLIKKPNIRDCGFVEYRNWVLVNYLLETGNRLNTVLNLKIEDIDLVNGMVILNKTKNRKTQYNPISEQLIKILTEYIKTYKFEREDYVFINESGEQMTRNSMQHTLARYNRKRGVQKTSIHAFRHTFAKHYITSGGDAFKLQRLLGHSTLDVTLNYVNLYSQDLKDGFDNHSILTHLTESSRMKRGRQR